MIDIRTGDCLEVLRTLPDSYANTCITSPPYFGLRDYGVDGQIGLEQTPAAYVAKLVEVFRDVRRVLRDDGTLWLNLGDSYNAGTTKPSGASKTADVGGWTTRSGDAAGARRCNVDSLKVKDLIGIPWRVAFALQDDGWYLRQDIIWHKPNPMPESVRDRCTKAHEYLFLLSKSPRYYFDADAIKEPAVGGLAGNTKPTKGGRAYEAGASEHRTAAGLHKWAERQRARVDEQNRKALRTDTESRHRSSIPGGQSLQADPDGMRNRRSVWTVATRPFKGAHFATFPPDLIEPCVLAGCPAGGMVLDPFGGAGTTGLVAKMHGRAATLIELNPEYAEMARERVCRIAAIDKHRRQKVDALTIAQGSLFA